MDDEAYSAMEHRCSDLICRRPDQNCASDNTHLEMDAAAADLENATQLHRRWRSDSDREPVQLHVREVGLLPVVRSRGC